MKKYKKLQRKQKASARARAKVEYLLAGKMFCGYCGVNMIAVGGTSQNGTQHHYYKCNNKRKKPLFLKKFMILNLSLITVSVPLILILSPPTFHKPKQSL